jgi:hypothetical protein
MKKPETDGTDMSAALTGSAVSINHAPPGLQEGAKIAAGKENRVASNQAILSTTAVRGVRPAGLGVRQCSKLWPVNLAGQRRPIINYQLSRLALSAVTVTV